MSVRPQGILARVGISCAALLVAFAMLAAAPLPSAWKHWRYSRAIELPASDAPRLVSIAAPLDMYRRAKPGLADVRVIDDQGAEVPYTAFRQTGTSNTAALPSTLRENSFTAGKFTQLVVDLGTHAPFHNALRIDTSRSDFIEWVQVEASDDGHLWRMVQERAPIFRFLKDHHQGTQVVHYGENNAQYLRVRILDGDAKFPVSGVSQLHEVIEPAERVPMGITLLAATNQLAGRSDWTAEVGPAAALVTEVRFAVESPAEFVRSVHLSTSNDGKDWDTFNSAEIYRYRRGDAALEKLSVTFPNAEPERYLRVEIVNGNDAPLTAAAPQLYITPQHIVFEQQPGRRYSLIYGQERAEAARYDLGRRLDAKQMAVAVAGQAGPDEVNTDWVDPRAWTETHDMFLWVVMLAAVVLIGYAAVRSLRRSARVSEP